MVTLRPYQQAALKAVVETVQIQQDILLQAATGAGKTIMFSALIQAFIQRYKMRIVVLAHREQLVRQAYDKLLKVWPEGEDRIGLACASVSSRVELEKPVIIGSVQTFANQMRDMPQIHMLIVDECHRIPPKGKGSQYEKLVNGLRQIYPKMRLLGVTATPYRLGQGYIYGDEEDKWFPDLTYEIGIEDLQTEGFLCPLTAYGIADPDLSGVKTSHGEFVTSALSEAMSEGVHLESALRAFEQYAQDRQHIVIFAVSIEHAELLQKVFAQHGHRCAIIHSEMPHADRQKALADFASGHARFIVNVGVLTEGWDCPETDCILLCRPTQSTALYVQMIGRGLRIAEGKQDCLLLDLSGNWKRHGNPAHPRVRTGGRGTDKEQADTVECPECRRLNSADLLNCAFCGAFLDPDAADKDGFQCFNCETICSPRAIRCPVCGTLLKQVHQEAPPMQKLETQENSSPVLARVVGSPRLNCNFVSKSGNHMARLFLDCEITGHDIPTPVSVFLDLEGQGSHWGQQKAQRLWRTMTGNEPPSTLEEAAQRAGELRLPPYVTMQLEKGYWKILRWHYGNAYTA